MTGGKHSDHVRQGRYDFGCERCWTESQTEVARVGN